MKKGKVNVYSSIFLFYVSVACVERVRGALQYIFSSIKCFLQYDIYSITASYMRSHSNFSGKKVATKRIRLKITVSDTVKAAKFTVNP